MAILALDTSTSVGSIALARAGEVLAESSLAVHATHSESVLPEIRRLMSATGLEPADLTTLVVGAGPGSFTGVRIAASLAKGICFARQIELFAYSSLAVVAAGASVAGRVCALFDARRGQGYGAGYEVGDAIEEIMPPVAVSLQELLDRLGAARDWWFAGDGAEPGRESIEREGGRILPPDTWHPRASSLVWLARVSPGTGRVSDPRTWEPRYLRLPAAQRGQAD